jgi:D-sedoheptulose 7-phosphate isomerase
MGGRAEALCMIEPGAHRGGWFLKTTERTAVTTFAKKYIERLKSLLDSLELESIAEVVELLRDLRERRKSVYIIGNGGSAATATHMALDLSFCTRMCEGPRLRAISLATNISYITAAANDLNYEVIFEEQLKDLLQNGDAVIAISASGNSPNILRAVKFAKAMGATTVGITGFTGGRLKEMCDLTLHVESEEGDYGPVEDIHMILDHLITAYFIEQG